MKFKIVSFLFTIGLLFACSSSDGDDPIPPNPQPTDDGKPTAVNDDKTMTEDSTLIMSDLLSNDSLLDNAKITAFDTSSANNGSIVDNRNGSFTYTPVKGFVGTDTFNYTICDDDDPTPNCSTATVTITVEDEGTPTAVNDTFNAVEDTSTKIQNYLDNDTLTDDAEISVIDTSNTQGTAELNDDGSISFTPAPGFLGEDSIVYTICDDDTNATCVSGTITITVNEKIDQNIPDELAAYYEMLGITSISELNFEQVKSHTSGKHSTILSYTQRHNYLYNADADLNKKDSVVLMYSGELRYWEEYGSGSNPYSPQTFNTEHVYPQSKLNSELAITDLHHLRVCDATINTQRSNYSFITGAGEYTVVNGNTWYPGDEWRGDVARMIMYLNVRYGEKFASVGTLELFLQWNVDDPVSEFEIQRNNVIEGAQGNRNPFIDNPYLATLIWGGDLAENKWK